jgi:hypothetical protein
MEPKRSALHKSTERIGRSIDQHLKVFHIETVLNNKMFGDQVYFLGKQEEDFTEFDRMKFQSNRAALQRMPRAMKRRAWLSASSRSSE